MSKLKFLSKIIIILLTIMLIIFFNCQQPAAEKDEDKDEKKDDKKDSGIKGFIFAGGTEVDVFGFVDLNDNGVLDDGDPFTYESNININGNQTSTFTFPDDFEILPTPPNSGSIFFSLSNAVAYNGKKYYFLSLAFKAYPQIINNAEIVDGNTPILPLQLDGVTQIFYGGADVTAVGLIDVDDDGIMDKNDLLISGKVIIDGDILCEAVPGVFFVVSDCGFISVNLSNASAFNGKKFYCGAIYPDSGYPVANNNAIISSGTIPTLPLQSLKLDEEVLVTHQFLPGIPVSVGGFIDINGNGIMDNGDFAGGASGPITIAGNMTVNLNAGLFEKVSNSGFISVNLKFTDAYDDVKGKKFYYGTFHVNGYKAIVNNTVINSNNMTLVIK